MSSYVSTLAGDKHKKCHPIYMPRLPLVPPQLNSQQPPNGIRNGVGRRNVADQPPSPLRASSATLDPICRAQMCCHGGESRSRISRFPLSNIALHIQYQSKNVHACHCCGTADGWLTKLGTPHMALILPSHYRRRPTCPPTFSCRPIWTEWYSHQNKSYCADEECDPEISLFTASANVSTPPEI